MQARTALRSEDTMLLGIDESGRGPVIGDLVVSGVLLPSEDSESLLADQGIRDSKKLTRRRREKLYPLIRKASVRILTRVISPKEVDSWRRAGGSLNDLEAKYFAQIIKEARPQHAIVDCADVVPETFQRRLEKYLGDWIPPITCEHFADKNYPVVSAASIVAKVTRDQSILKLNQEYGLFGSGYCSDQRTIKFLEEWFETKGDFPPFVRKTWQTAHRIRDQKKQRRL